MLEDDSPYALVADDDAFIAMDACQILEDAGFRTFQAANVDAALAVLKENAKSIQLLFSDVQMPPSERDGFELARLTAESWPHICIIVTSGVEKPGPGVMPEGARF
ncbi:response regulator [Aureimonas frigidaquae]|uniref:response regulator n=1 Tax=Aureimonas frigidaquae TaxID=424757 RepID=UPI000AA78993|nr:response regulator [Aureimonas frigidaquae]